MQSSKLDEFGLVIDLPQGPGKSMEGMHEILLAFRQLRQKVKNRRDAGSRPAPMVCSVPSSHLTLIAVQLPALTMPPSV